MKNYIGKKRKKMGLRYNVREFNFSPKLRLKDPLNLYKYGKLLNMSVESWILQDCYLLYEAIYVRKLGLRITLDAWRLLMDQLSAKYPECVEAIKEEKYSEIQRKIDIAKDGTLTPKKGLYL